MKKIMLMLLICINLLANDTVYVENYQLDVGRYKDRIYSGYINIDGFPSGKGNLMCKDNPKIYEVENGEFIDGKIKSGKWRSCYTYKSKFFNNVSYYQTYEGIFGNYDNFNLRVPLDKSKVTLIFTGNNEFNKLEGLYEYKQDGVPNGGLGFSLREQITGTMIRKKGLISLTCKFVLHKELRCYEGKLSFLYDNGLAFNGYLTNSNKLMIDGTLTWADGSSHEYKGEWSTKILNKLKDRLDAIQKTKSIN